MWPDKEDEVSDGQAVSAAVVISENALDIYGGETYRRTNRDPSRGRRMAFKFGIREKNGTVANSVTLKVEVIQGTRRRWYWCRSDNIWGNHYLPFRSYFNRTTGCRCPHQG